MKNEQKLTIRNPQLSDAELLIDFAKIIFSSTNQVLTTIEEFTNTIEQQENWIKSCTDNPHSIIFIAEIDNQIIGLLDFAVKKRKKTRHTGEFGVSVHPKYRGQGIGRKLIESLINWAKNNLMIEKITLNVFSSNTNAIHLYKSLGFIEESRQIKAIKQDNDEYVDLIGMYLFLK